jgi:hypothetical protein
MKASSLIKVKASGNSSKSMYTRIECNWSLEKGSAFELIKLCSSSAYVSSSSNSGPATIPNRDKSSVNRTVGVGVDSLLTSFNLSKTFDVVLVSNQSVGSFFIKSS